MVGTRKTDRIQTSYSQLPAQDIWQREAEAQEEASEEDSKESLPPLSMGNGSRLRLQLGDGDDASEDYCTLPKNTLIQICLLLSSRSLRCEHKAPTSRTKFGAKSKKKQTPMSVDSRMAVTICYPSHGWN